MGLLYIRVQVSLLIVTSWVHPYVLLIILNVFNGLEELIISVVFVTSEFQYIFNAILSFFFFNFHITAAESGAALHVYAFRLNS